MEIQENNKKIDKFFKKLTMHCSMGDVSSLSSEISMLMGPYFIRRFREHKLILKAPVESRCDLATCLLSCAQELEQVEYERLENYLEFSIAGDMVCKNLLKDIHAKIRYIGSFCELEILDIADEIYNSIATNMANSLLSHSTANQIAEHEKRLHDLNGNLVDLSSGLARVINEIHHLGLINNSEMSGRCRDRESILAATQTILKMCCQLNSLEWLLDEVSFGKFFVAESDCSNAHFRLDFTDAKMALMRRLATRRSLILKFAGAREERHIRNELHRLHSQLLDYALDYYCETVNITELNSEIIEQARARVLQSLIIIDAEDDLLFAASRGHERVISYYVAGFSLTCFAIAGEAVRDSLRRDGVESPIMDIPLSIIRDGIIIDTGKSFIAEALAALSVTLPARSHIQLHALRFVRNGDDVIRPFLNGYSGMWNVMVRNALTQGGHLGKDVGAIWEGFIAFCFKDTPWQVIGNGIKLRRGGKVVTDVDLLLLQNDLLLVVQIKSLIGSADTPYDHWKNLQVIEQGCIQARKSADFLTENTDLMISICGKKASNKIRIIQPLVLTNIHHLEGLNLFDVPVIGEATRKAICRGSIVNYINSNGQHLHTHVFVTPEQLDTKEILRLLKEPIELQIASERPLTVFREEQLGCLKFLLPEFSSTPKPFQPPGL
ncbi:hypothetical protein [Aeromonas veronii]|uniref:hypothetical protein n=1 Tax=Aeromonas veronii TaxID=654 RepID=UPI001F20233F|nr:hypothetical protein [Aeromonas veronii]MCF5858516.1 hypothetical protein [Aeromonas veronii]